MNELLMKKVRQWNLIENTYAEARQKLEQYLVSEDIENNYKIQVDISLSKCGINFEPFECVPQNIEVDFDYMAEEKNSSFYIGCYNCKYSYLTGEKIGEYIDFEEYWR